MSNPITREEQYLAKVGGEDTPIPKKPLTREEQFLAAAAGEDVTPPTPITRKEQYLGKIAAGGGGGGDEPTGTKEITITQAGTSVHDVKQYASAEITTEGLGPVPSGTKQITISDVGTVTEDVEQYEDAQITTQGLVKPTGNKAITVSQAGSISDIDVSEFATASVTTEGLGPAPSGTKQITANGTNIDVSEYEKVDVAVPMPALTPYLGLYLDWDNAVQLPTTSNYLYTTPSKGVFMLGFTSNTPAVEYQIRTNTWRRVIGNIGGNAQTAYIGGLAHQYMAAGAGVTFRLNISQYSDEKPNVFVPFKDQSIKVPDWSNFVFFESGETDYVTPSDGMLVVWNDSAQRVAGITNFRRGIIYVPKGTTCQTLDSYSWFVPLET